MFKPDGGEGSCVLGKWPEEEGEEEGYRTVKEVAQSVDDWCGYVDCLGFGVDGVYVRL